VLDAYRAAVADGDSTATDAIASQGLAELELIRRNMVCHLAKQGAVLKEAITSQATGEVLGQRIRLHPAVEGVARFAQLLGHTSEARRLDPKARGEGARDEALAKALARDAFLRGYSGKHLMAPPPTDDIVEAVAVPSSARTEPGGE
jgi:hypothetical protein